MGIPSEFALKKIRKAVGIKTRVEGWGGAALDSLWWRRVREL